MIPVVKENNKLKLALALSTGTPIIFVKKYLDTTPLVSDKPK